jgi:hypothetical protein
VQGRAHRANVADGRSSAVATELIACIPGKWSDRSEFLGKIADAGGGQFTVAGGKLIDLEAQEHVLLELCDPDPNLAQAFRIAGQGKLTEEVLARVAEHSSVAYLRFPADILEQRERLMKFTRLLARSGGLAIKLESSGIAHTLESWLGLLVGNPFDLYCASVVLVAGEAYAYSCGMHHFGLPDSAIPRSLGEQAAEVMNRFNYWRIAESPVLATGHTFSVAADAPPLRTTLVEDSRYPASDPFHNPHGVWRLDPA